MNVFNVINMTNKLVQRFNRYLEEELREIEKEDEKLAHLVRFILEFERENWYKQRSNYKKEFEKYVEILYSHKSSKG